MKAMKPMKAKTAKDADDAPAMKAMKTTAAAKAADDAPAVKAMKAMKAKTAAERRTGGRWSTWLPRKLTRDLQVKFTIVLLAACLLQAQTLSRTGSYTRFSTMIRKFGRRRRRRRRRRRGRRDSKPVARHRARVEHRG